MQVLCAILVGCMVAASVYLILNRNLVRFIFGLVLVSNAINLLIFTVGRLDSQRPPLIPLQETAMQETLANALPQALILTAIVIGFALLSFILVLFYFSHIFFFSFICITPFGVHTIIFRCWIFFHPITIIIPT